MGRAPDETRFAYADSRRLLRETLDAFLPPERIRTAEHAATHRWVKAAAGPHLERYDHATAPYLRGIMDALDEDGLLTVAVVGSASSGKTAGPAESWLLKTIHADPVAMLWYMHTEDGIEKYVKTRIEPMLDAHEKLIGHLRLGRDSVSLKRFRGGQCEFLPFTHSTLVNKHVVRIIADEYDAFDRTLGDPIELLNARRQAAGADSRVLAISHPDLGLPIGAPAEKQRGVMKLYAGSDRRTWWWQCPECGAFSSPNPGTPRRMVITYPEDAPLAEIEAKARLLCPVNGCLIEDGQRHAMNLTGRWVCAGEECDLDGRITGERIRNSVAGFWIVGPMSAFVLGGIGGLARNRVAAERALAQGGDMAALRTVIVKGWGEPYAPPRAIGSVDAATLAERAEPTLRLREVPEGVRVLTAFVDVQGNRFELLVRGWGAGMESWIVDHQAIEADPAVNPDDWDALLRRLATLSYPLADGSGRHMRVRGAAYDSQGQPGVTEQAYAAWRRARRAQLARRLGQVSGRDAWSLLPSKGGTSLQAPRITLAYPDSQRRDRRVAARGEVPILFFNPSAAKDALAAQLARAEAGPPAVHFPAGLLAKEPPHPFFEQLCAERRLDSGRWEKIDSHARNEVVDLMVGCDSVALLHGLHRLDWANPPAWAAPWETNSMIVKPEVPAIADAIKPPAVPSAEAVTLPPAVKVPPPVVRARPRYIPSTRLWG